MFLVPSTSVPFSVSEAAARLRLANDLFEYILNAHKSEFRAFWFDSGQAKSKEQINAILIAMDEAGIGQSSKYFDTAKKLVDLIIAINPESLVEGDWMPLYEYEVDSVTSALRVK